PNRVEEVGAKHSRGMLVEPRPAANASPLTAGTQSRSLQAIVPNFKSVSTRKINQVRDNPSHPVWQRNYYERIVRNEHELNAIRSYIGNNLQQWTLDAENPVRLAKAQKFKF